MKRWSLDRPIAQAGRNDGISVNGLRLVRLVDLEWSRSWVAEIPDDELEAMDEAKVADLRRLIEEIDAAETTYLGCVPEARGAANAYMAEMLPDDWEERFTWFRLLARRAEVEEKKILEGNAP